MYSKKFPNSNEIGQEAPYQGEYSPDSIIAYLQDFGLTNREARLFFVLSKLGSATASEAGNAAKFSRLQTYRSLKGIIDKGLVEISLERPRRYAPLRIDQAISLLEQETERRILEMENKKALLLKRWEEIADLQPEENNSTFRIIQGKKNVFKFNLSLCKSSKKEIATVLKSNDLNRWIAEGADDVLQKIAHKNILLKSLSDVNEHNADASKIFLKFCGLRHTSQPNLAPLTIIDNSEVLIGLSDNDGVTENAIWTNHGELVGMLKGFFDLLWEMAQDGNSRLQQIKQTQSIKK